MGETQFHNFGSNMEEIQFWTNFVQRGISKTLTALVYQEFWIQNEGNSIWDHFCPNGYFKNFDNISMSKRPNFF